MHSVHIIFPKLSSSFSFNCFNFFPPLGPVIRTQSHRRRNQFDKVAKHLTEYKLKEVDCKGILAALTFIFKSAAKYACDADVLSNELQQLGLHRDGAQLLARLYQLRLKELRRALEQNSFRGEPIFHVFHV